MTAPAQISYDQFNDQQKEAVRLAIEWFKGWKDGRHKKQVFRLAGFAGTGKTTVARYIAEQCSGGANFRVEFIAPTGKAASRLRQKGCPTAKTLHQFVYNVRGEDEEGDPIFVGKGMLDYTPVLVVMDESSMVGQYDFEAVERHGIPILALGDYGQVPPVKAAQVFNESNADFTLTEIERNAGNIVRASMFVRGGNSLPFREYDDVQIRPGLPTDEEVVSFCAEDAVMLSSYHNTRIALNKRARRLLGHTDMMPQVGEKLVCRFNQHEHGIMNGEQGIVLGFDDVPDYEKDENDHDGVQYIRYKSLTYMKERRAKFNPICFYEGAQFEEVRKDAMKAIGAWDFGYCLTIHSSQGSEWDRVLMMDEFMRGVPYAQLAYTRITRAISHLLMYRER